jgi:hypothetical protein
MTSTAQSGERAMEAAVRRLFERYALFFRQSLAGEIDTDDVASLYASDFIAASPAGVMSGKNDNQFRQAMAQGYAVFGRVTGGEQALLKQHGIT